MKITQIQRFSVDDGPGIRTTIFTSGCNLHCRWCHNPEAMIGEWRLLYDESKCIGCGACGQVCRNGVHCWTTEGVHHLNRMNCRECASCIKACPTGALRRNWEEISEEKLVERILRDRAFYQKKGDKGSGGVTFSGGEPLLWAEDIQSVAKKCREEGIHVAVDTAACVPFHSFELLFETVDLFLIDCKAYTEELHIRNTGVSNRLILENIRRVSESGVPVWIRIPVIPGLNDSDNEMEQISEFLAAIHISQVELLPYHKMGVNKYRLLGLPYDLPEIEPPTAQKMEELNRLFREKGVPIYENNQ